MGFLGATRKIGILPTCFMNIPEIPFPVNLAEEPHLPETTLPCLSGFRASLHTPDYIFCYQERLSPKNSSPVFSYKRIDKWAPEVPRGGGGVPLKTKVFIPGHVLIKLHTPTPWTSRASHCERHRHFNQMAQIGCLL